MPSHNEMAAWRREQRRFEEEHGARAMTRDLPDDKRERSTDALDHEDLILVLHVIDFALEHDRLARKNFGTDAALTTESRIGINNLRAKIRAAL